MIVSKVRIENFKIFQKFEIDFKDGVNIIVGDNETGKSTILEAIHLALSGMFQGKYLKNELNQYIFHSETVNKYIDSFKSGGEPLPLPEILIEVCFDGENLALYEGDGNSQKAKGCGISLTIKFDEDYQSSYEEFVRAGEINTIPIEFYKLEWKTFAREQKLPRDFPIKSVLIDSSSNRYQNGSDVYISRIINENLDDKERNEISITYRKLKEKFAETESVRSINTKIKEAAQISTKDVNLSIDLSSRNSWETSLMTYLDETPFHFIGKGEQSIVKTFLALSHNKNKEANLLLLEEPENHLSHTRLNELVKRITEKITKNEESDKTKQLIISTHSSFVANKLGLENLILINKQKTFRFPDLTKETYNFFKKLPGYNTLRLLLCEKAILVEGDSDELVVQKAYRTKNQNKLPIEDRIDVISVGTAFLRFLEIAERLNKTVKVVTDNDGNVEALQKKYENYVGANEKEKIKICFDQEVESGSLMIGDKKFNYNTLEPKLLKVNNLDTFNRIFGTSFSEENEMHKYMKNNKTDCALKIFETSEVVTFPQYILDAFE